MSRADWCLHSDVVPDSLLQVVFGDRSPAASAVLLLPLVTYHLLELVNGLVLSARLKQWVDASKPTPLPLSSTRSAPALPDAAQPDAAQPDGHPA